MTQELKKCPSIMPTRFINKIQFTKDCWLWIGAKQSKGYGHININGKNILAHRFSYSFNYGGIPKRMTIDHKCRNRLCVNPYHLRLMTQKDNNLCGESPPSVNKRKTHCIHGHEFNIENTRIKHRKDGDHRECRKCASILSIKYIKKGKK